MFIPKKYQIFNGSSMVKKDKITDNSNIIYGVDVTKKVTSIMVRDAIIRCFYEAHNDVLELARDSFGNPPRKKFEEMKKEHVKNFVQDIFQKIDGDFYNPSKKELFKVIENLRDFASIYRDPNIIKKHFTEILLLIDKIG